MFATKQEWFEGVVTGQYATVKAAISVFEGQRDSEGLTALMRAAAIGDDEMCRILAVSESGCATPQGYTALMLAALGDNEECVRILAPLEQAIILRDCRTPLMLAAEAGSAKACSVLLKWYGPESDANGLTALDYAVLAGHVDVVRSLLLFGRYSIPHLRRSLEMAHTCVNPQVSLLIREHLASLEGNVAARAACQTALLSFGQTRCAPRDQNGRPMTSKERIATLEHDNSQLRAKMEGTLERVADLCRQNEAQSQSLAALTRTVDVLSRDRPASRTFANNSSQVTDVIVAKPDTAISTVDRFATIDEKDVSIPVTLGSRDTSLKSGGDDSVAVSEPIDSIEPTEPAESSTSTGPNTLSLLPSEGKTSLMIAIQNFQLMTAQELIRNEVGKTDSRGYTALMYAAAYGIAEMVILLAPLETGRADHEGKTALMHAAVLNNETIVDILALHEACLRMPSGDTALHLATRAGAARAVRALAKVEARLLDRSGRTALMIATDLGNVELCRTLAQFEGGLFDMNGNTALHMAVYKGDPALVSAIAPYEARFKNRADKTPLMIAIEAGLEGIVRIIASYDTETLGEGGNNALMLAAQRGSVTATGTISQYSTSPRARNQEGSTALEVAIRSRQYDKTLLLAEKDPCAMATRNTIELGNRHKLIRDLLSAIDDDNIVSVWQLLLYVEPDDEQLRMDLLRQAILKGRMTTSMLISDSMWPEDALAKYRRAISDGITESGRIHFGTETLANRNVRVMMNNANNLNDPASFHDIQRNNDGRTPLHIAALNDDVIGVWKHLRDCAGLLDNFGETALMLAARANSIPCTRLLMGQEAGGVNHQGETALSIALRKRNIPLANILLPLEGVSTSRFKRTNNCLTELMTAARDNDIVTCYCLLQLQGGLLDPEGRTALYYAAEAGHTDIVEMLLAHESRRQARNGWSALMVAAYNGHTGCVELLAPREAGMTTDRGVTALMLAASQGHVEASKPLFTSEAGIQTTTGYTALIAAIERDCSELVTLLLPIEGKLREANEKPLIEYATSDKVRELIRARDEA
ncbi:Ankyrin repeat protein 1 [Giardia muris]|uniref:Ankyrin repeat protein 1 n=1 Tax=Giardia muris TaxID=5742 RepID=A0A4Z1TDI6_GIAMU|nr:Ankyrin repeat protein 1 [Giardia muris]|eukprot:TNJ30609.1 Ankyrin repeat protein 1 [Giardia muris]